MTEKQWLRALLREISRTRLCVETAIASLIALTVAVDNYGANASLRNTPLTTKPPHDALYRLGLRIQSEGRVPPRPLIDDPVPGRRDPVGFYTINHYSGKPILRSKGK